MNLHVIRSAFMLKKTTKKSLDVTENLQLLETLPSITSEREVTNNHFSYLKEKS